MSRGDGGVAKGGGSGTSRGGGFREADEGSREGEVFADGGGEEVCEGVGVGGGWGGFWRRCWGGQVEGR